MKARNAEQRARWLADPETILADVLAAQTQKRKVTDPIPLWHLRAMQAGRARWVEAKARAAVKRNRKRRREWNRANRPQHANHGTGGLPIRFAKAMAPGEWYGLKAVGRAVGATHEESCFVRMTLVKRAWVERAANPLWDPNAWRDGARREPKWLFRLTPAGETARAAFQ